jgi:hypothetical protein
LFITLGLIAFIFLIFVNNDKIFALSAAYLGILYGSFFLSYSLFSDQSESLVKNKISLRHGLRLIIILFGSLMIYEGMDFLRLQMYVLFSPVLVNFAQYFLFGLWITSGSFGLKKWISS